MAYSAGAREWIKVKYEMCKKCSATIEPVTDKVVHLGSSFVGATSQLFGAKDSNRKVVYTLEV